MSNQNAPQTPALVKWVQLNAQHPSIRLVASKKAWGSVRLEVTGASHLTDVQRDGLRKLGFGNPKRWGGEAFVRKEIKIALAELRRVFPDAAEVMMPRVDATHVAPPRPGALALDDEMLEAKLAEVTVVPVGHNSQGESVFESDEGRYVRHADGTTEFEGADPDATFLRADSLEELARCADAFVGEMVRGKNMRADDLKQFAATVTGIPVGEVEQTTELRRVQEAVEAALVRRLREDALAPGATVKDVYAQATRLLERQPAMAARTSSSIMLQQYSSPLPMGYAAQQILGRTEGRTLLEPTIGNGSLISATRGAHVVGADLDKNRLDQLALGRPEASLHHVDATTADFIKLNGGSAFDLICCNPPFGKLDSAMSVKGLKVTRLDQLVLMRALDARKDDGLGVFIIGGDSYVDTRAGKVSGTSRYLFNWLADNYHVDVVEIPGRLYAKQGATFPVRMVVVGRRAPGGEQVPDTIPLVDSAEELLAWSLRMREKYAAHVEPIDAATQEAIAVAEAVEEAEVAPSPTAAQDAKANTTDADENSYQSPYPAMSRVGQATAMVPRNLLTPTLMALQNVVAVHGDIDEYVASQLDWSVEQMGNYLSPEQVDALALAMHAEQRSGGKQGFLMGDQTGQGKGRFLAAMARYHNLAGRSVVFLTETPTLFTDFWRDLRAISSTDLFQPMIVNAGVGVYDDITGDQLIKPTPAAVVKRAVDEGEVPSEYNLVLGTYSQFNRDRNASSNSKSNWITRATQGAAVILDESHNAAGESNTNNNIALAVDSSYSVTYSSATSIKEPKNLAIYSRLFPASVNIGALPETLATGGEALQEVLSSMLAADGVFIRREHDLSDLEFRVIADTEERQERNRELSDHLAGILEVMNYIAGDINEFVSERNKEIRKQLEGMTDQERKGNRMGAVSINYFSRLFNIYRQFLLALQVDLAADRAIEALKAGQKPVFVLENTMESLLKETLLGLEGDEELTAEELAERIANPDMAGTSLGEGLTFADVLHRVLDKLAFYEESDRYGERSKVAISSESAIEGVKRTRELINAMPMLAVSPIDVIRHRVEQAGFKCGELTGRKLGLRNQDGEWYPYQIVQKPKAQVVQSFISGEDDAVVLSRSGSTGISLHTDPKFRDKRQRVMFEVQMALDVSKRIQFHGRVNRRGQTSSPIIESLSTGLPGQARPIAMANAKLRKLSANVTSNQDNASLDANVPDFLNAVGDDVAYRYLDANPDIARRLDIDMDLETDREREPAFFVNKLTSRLVMLRVSEQEEIYAALTTEYTRLIAEMDEKGINPLKSKEVDLQAREYSREIYEAGDASSNSVFSQPIYLRTIKCDRILKPLRWSDVQARIDACKREYEQAIPHDPLNAFQRYVQHAHRDLVTSKPEIMERALPRKFKNVQEALDHKDNNAVKNAQKRVNFLITQLGNLELGGQVTITGNDNDPVTGVIVHLAMPVRERQKDSLSAYLIRVAVPGSSTLVERSFYSLHEDPMFELVPSYRTDMRMEEKFEMAPEGKVTDTRYVLDGNMFKAAQLAAQQRLGSSVVYTDEDGQRHRGVLLSRGFEPRHLQELPVAMETPDQLLAVMGHDRTARLSTSCGMEASADVDTFLYQHNGQYVLQCPGTKIRGGHVFANDDLVKLVGEFAGSRSTMSARFDSDKLPQVAAILNKAGILLYAPARMRAMLNEKRASLTTYNNESYMQESDRDTRIKMSA
ncbi:strawberry notch family protein [Pseudoxanthomonas sp. LjRoot168]|uniref:strawberry notch-like NTP hydrolase domain-containing protein n=1 Tax=unclassified Pseudoxanthomonas TaxID=2645906 RepID=UPI003ED06505